MPDVIIVEDQNPKVVIVSDEEVSVSANDENVFVNILSFDIIVFEMIVGAPGAPAHGSTSFQFVDASLNPLRGRRIQFFRDGAFMHRTTNHNYDPNTATVDILDAELLVGEPLEVWMFKANSVVVMHEAEPLEGPVIFESQFETQFE